ncbi:nucleocapsid protein [Tigray virus]|uniref:Nucleoprotein n=1 Tax=Tigray virus TaxID=1268011 RepID=A0A1C9TA31_9VIRU|nr:nucleocapsid protein [Tigray virus]
MENLQKELSALEGQFVVAGQKLKDAEQQYDKDPDELNRKLVQERQGTVTAYQTKIEELRRQIADQLLVTKPSERTQEVPGLEPDDHLKEKSTLRYGNVLDVNPIDIDEPSGQTADWVSITTYVVGFVAPILLKALYMLTTRGRQTIKDNKGTRIRFKDDSSVEDINGIRRPKHLYISLPSSQSSMKADEVTPGRYRTIICGLYPAHLKARQMISPVMGVIGFPVLVKNWDDRIQTFLDGVCPFMKASPDLSSQLYSAEATNRDYLRERQTQLGEMETEECKKIRNIASSSGCTVVGCLDSPSAIWAFAGSPDRCPPTCLYVAGMAELGAFLSILQDMRNTIIASKTVGTAEEKLRKKSSFYQSYLRRTQSMGLQIDQRIIILFMVSWGKEVVDHFHLGDDMDPELRTLAQSLIDVKVKEISNQEPLKL